MSSSRPTAASNSSIQPEASSSAITNEAPSILHTQMVTPFQLLLRPSGSSFPTRQIAHMEPPRGSNSKLPMPPTYEFFRYVDTDIGTSVIQPPDVQSTGLISVYPSDVAAKTSGSSWLWQHLKDTLPDDGADRALPREKGRASLAGAWK